MGVYPQLVGPVKLLVDEFSNFARLPTANPRPDDLNRIVADVVAGYSGTEGVELRAELAESLPTLDVDREQMRRALTNLVDNAIAAVRADTGADDQAGHVVVRTAHEPSLNSVRLEVADDGGGIAPADRRRVFEPYFSTKARGTGLGLSIVSRIVADHHGTIRVLGNHPRGARFVATLPIPRFEGERRRVAPGGIRASVARASG